MRCTKVLLPLNENERTQNLFQITIQIFEMLTWGYATRIISMISFQTYKWMKIYTFLHYDALCENQYLKKNVNHVTYAQISLINM